MKYAYLLFSSIFLFSLFTNCGSNKDLQEKAPAQFKDSYTTSGDGELVLHIPVVAIQEKRVSMDSVYFRGMRASLKENEQALGEYIAKFKTRGDMVMNSDPKKEYGNKPPQKPVKSPVELQQDEVLLVFTKNGGKRKYYKITGITSGK